MNHQDNYGLNFNPARVADVYPQQNRRAPVKIKEIPVIPSFLPPPKVSVPLPNFNSKDSFITNFKFIGLEYQTVRRRNDRPRLAGGFQNRVRVIGPTQDYYIHRLAQEADIPDEDDIDDTTNGMDIEYCVTQDDYIKYNNQIREKYQIMNDIHVEHDNPETEEYAFMMSNMAMSKDGTYVADNVIDQELPNGFRFATQPNGLIFWKNQNGYHREGKPAIIRACRPWPEGEILKLRIYNFSQREYWIDGKRHCVTGPAVDSPQIQEWWVRGKLHRQNEPAVVTPKSEQYWVDGKLHCTSGPAVLHKETGGEEWWLNGERHREGHPAVIKYIKIQGAEYKVEEWWLNGNRHRKDDPAVVISAKDSDEQFAVEYWECGTHIKTIRYDGKFQYIEDETGLAVYDENNVKFTLDAKLRLRKVQGPELLLIYSTEELLHTVNDMPAYVYNGTKAWLMNGVLHRENHKPAIVFGDGRHEWYQNGKKDIELTLEMLTVNMIKIQKCIEQIMYSPAMMHVNSDVLEHKKHYDATFENDDDLKGLDEYESKLDEPDNVETDTTDVVGTTDKVVEDTNMNYHPCADEFPLKSSNLRRFITDYTRVNGNTFGNDLFD